MLMNFSDLPFDILLKCACELDVKDVSCLERTCTIFRDVVATRDLWLSQLYKLEPHCAAPVLPPHTAVGSLSYANYAKLWSEHLGATI
ncbi:hypothetical protein ACEPAH_1728 [Sanghuangporus vaninii]